MSRASLESPSSKIHNIFNVFLNLCAEFATEQRGWFVIIFVLPFSVLYDVYFTLRARLVLHFYSAPKLHESRVRDVSNQLRSFHAEQNELIKSGATTKRKKLCTARGGWQSMSPSLRPYKDKAKGISINMYDILEFDESKMTLRVEPMVNMGQISHFLIPKGYTIPVLPEMDDLTVGGLMMGVGIETSSHKYGLFNDSVLEAELILANGDVIRCSHDENKDLFDAIPWSYGTIGFLTSVTIRVTPCKPFVKVYYIPTLEQKKSVNVFQACSLLTKSANRVSQAEAGTSKLGNNNGTSDWEEVNPSDSDEKPRFFAPGGYFEKSAEKYDFDFVEGLMYTRDKMVVMPAKYASKEEVFQNSVESSKVNQIGLWFKPWFFKHVEFFFEKPSSLTVADCPDLLPLVNVCLKKNDVVFYEYIPLRDYFHRHTKSIFWELQEIIPFGNHPIVRYLLGWALPPKVSFLKMTQTKKIKEIYEKNHIIQDMMVPFSKMNASIDVFDTYYGIYPLWVCPYRAYDYEKLKKYLYTNETEPSTGVQEDYKKHRYFLRKPNDLVKNECFEMYVDLGAYGVPSACKDPVQKETFDVVKTSRAVEKFVYDVHGFQMLYATSYQDRSEFREMFDHKHYDLMKQKYDPDNCFPQIYDKVCKRGMQVWETGNVGNVEKSTKDVAQKKSQ